LSNHKKYSRRRSFQDVDPDFAAALLADDVSTSGHNRRHDHKTLQLCAQVRDALSLAMAGECHDDVLRDLYVDAVEPAPNASRLLVRLVVPARTQIEPAILYEHLARVGPFLRTIVAREICRKRAPDLTFLPVLESEVRL